MIYGRYNELDSYGIHGIYKPTNITGGPHPFFFSWEIPLLRRTIGHPVAKTTANWGYYWVWTTIGDNVIHVHLLGIMQLIHDPKNGSYKNSPWLGSFYTIPNKGLHITQI